MYLRIAVLGSSQISKLKLYQNWASIDECGIYTNINDHTNNPNVNNHANSNPNVNDHANNNPIINDHDANINNRWKWVVKISWSLLNGADELIPWNRRGLVLSSVAKSCPPLWWGRGIESCLDSFLVTEQKHSIPCEILCSLVGRAPGSDS